MAEANTTLPTSAPAPGGLRGALLSRAKFLGLMGGGGVLGYAGLLVGRRSIEGWRENTVETPTPKFDPAAYRLTVDGMCEQPFTLSYDDLRGLPAVTQVSDFHCVEGWTVPDVKWQGVRLQQIIERAKPSKDARYITFHSMGGIYRDSLSLQQAQLPDVLLAYDMDDGRLPQERGAPLRVVMPRMFGYKGAKWLRRIEFLSEQDIGYWENRGWRVDAWIKA
jgi:DMSO/TMAO reductase YedYZ molybdopterin-dependent catalytic subunit